MDSLPLSAFGVVSFEGFREQRGCQLVKRHLLPWLTFWRVLSFKSSGGNQGDLIDFCVYCANGEHTCHFPIFGV
ncbi:hypothetical protein I7I50_02657 [Histoplasma capsulatum G186AR]|uniref:Uncharacterized protein n=1 Tax=Ajellomyces capsulatus TaxID=5037 RepID=A0A8H7Z827_AJECA|nr:hypothetical protein I7I52_00677 [Histoplasma capsulatum]QSS71707.1 hypothetical protein I7I50_02657 [Histoplasma capsulatum G186AR]